MARIFEISKPTYIENWPKELRKLSFPSTGIRLTIDEAKALGSAIIEFGQAFGPRRSIDGIIQKVDKAIRKHCPDGAFVKLGSRSPKDRLYFADVSPKVTNGETAVKLMLGASERISDDLSMAIVNGYEPYIWVREWWDIPQWSEFRCFVRNEKLIGISQYYYREYFPEIAEGAEPIRSDIEYFWERELRPCMHLKDAIFDVHLYYEGGDHFVAKLIEINPFCPLTDPCLYNWAAKNHFELDNIDWDFDGGFRYVRERDIPDKPDETEEFECLMIERGFSKNGDCKIE